MPSLFKGSKSSELVREPWQRVLLLGGGKILSYAIGNRAIMWKHDVIHKTGSTYNIATPPDEDWATTCRKIGQVRPCGFWVMQVADRQTL